MRFTNRVATAILYLATLRISNTHSYAECFSLDHTCKRRKETGAHAIHGTGLRVFLMSHISSFSASASKQSHFSPRFSCSLFTQLYPSHATSPTWCNPLPVSSSLVPIRL
jgi:hypothetical protein